MTSHWRPEDVARIDLGGMEAPIIASAAAEAIIDGRILWDFWPLEERDGTVADIGSGELWFALCAPCGANAAERHGRARIRALHRREGKWRDLGNALPDGLSAGSREWSGSAIYDRAERRVTLFFTAAGVRGEAQASAAQRLFVAEATLDGDAPAFSAWSPPTEIAASDGDIYMRPEQHDGAPGAIKAFRDPAWFRDPADGRGYVLFAASLGRSDKPENGAVGIARAEDDALTRWTLLPPLIAADGVSNELERPHLRMFGDRYYLFWSTRREVFAGGAAWAPTGLYGMAADSIEGPWRPLNESGLVVANPSEAPAQAYSWWVLADGHVTATIEDIDHRFRGGFAPEMRLSVSGDRTQIETICASR